MRTAGLLLLAILFPAFAHADSLTLKTYTISHDTIYPTATVGSGLATTTAIDIGFFEHVKASIKIKSASGTLIKSLYSSSDVINPEPKIWDGTNVAPGIYTIVVSATSTATNLVMSDSSKTVTIALPGSTPPDDSSDTTEITETTTATPSNSGPAEYLPIPTLRIITSGGRTISSGADTAFTAVVYDGKGNKRDEAVVTWSFGDGMRRTGANVFHSYYNSGEYLAVVHAITSDGGNALKEIIITVKDAGIKIASVSSRGITLANNDSRTLDLSLWRLSMGEQEFKIPENTQILAGRTILFPSQVIELPIANSASLLYPSGEVADTFPAPAKGGPASGGKLLAPNTSINTVQSVEPPVVSKVEPIISTKTDVPANDEAVSAPAATDYVGAAGAALPDSPKTNTSSLFKSPWMLGLLGVIAIAGGAFILL